MLCDQPNESFRAAVYVVLFELVSGIVCKMKKKETILNLKV